MLEQEKLSHIIAVAFLLIVVSIIAVAEYFGLPVHKTLTDCEFAECPNGISKIIPNCDDVNISSEEIERAVAEGFGTGMYSDAWSDVEQWKGLVEYIEQKLGCTLEKSSNSSVTDTSTWKTYRNEQYGFEFRYPATLYPSGGPDQTFLAEKAISEKETFDFLDKLVEIRISNTIYRFNAYFNTPDNTIVESSGYLKLRSLEIGGFKALEYGYDEEAKKKEIEEQDDAMERGASVGKIVFPRGIMLNKNGTLVEISTDSYVGDFKEVFNQILSTFKFIE